MRFGSLLTAMRAASLLTPLKHGAVQHEQPAVRQVGTLSVARAAHTLTALPSGGVLIIGGMTDGGGSLGAVELFDPSRNTVRRIASLAESRVGHTSTLLRDGRVLVAGGYNGDYLASMEVFDPATRRFRPAGSLVEARSGHTATLLADGRVLFAGGIGPGWTFLKTAELFDPATGRSELVGSMHAARESHTATLLDDGQVLIVGGHAGRRPNVQVYASTEVFSPQTRRFESVGSLGTPRHKHDAVRMTDGRVLVIGGADHTDHTHYASTEVYDPRSRTFAAGPSMANPRYKIAGTSVLLPSGDILVTSGARNAERLELRGWKFHEIEGRFPAAFRFAAVASLEDGSAIVVGGYSDANENTAGIWRIAR